MAPPAASSCSVLVIVSPLTPGVTVGTGTGSGAERWRSEKRAAILVAAMAMMARLKPRVGAIGDPVKLAISNFLVIWTQSRRESAERLASATELL